MKACCLAYLFMCGDCFAVLGIGEKHAPEACKGAIRMYLDAKNTDIELIHEFEKSRRQTVFQL